MLLGYVSTRKSGTTFAMITLGLGELVAAIALMFPGFFGGEGGITLLLAFGEAEVVQQKYIAGLHRGDGFRRGGVGAVVARERDRLAQQL